MGIRYVEPLISLFLVSQGLPFLGCRERAGGYIATGKLGLTKESFHWWKTDGTKSKSAANFSYAGAVGSNPGAQIPMVLQE